MLHVIFSRKWAAMRRTFLMMIMAATVAAASSASHAAYAGGVAHAAGVAAQATPQSKAVQGETIPQDFLELEKKRCMDGCTSFNEEGLCESLCTCSVDQFKARFSFPDYLALSVEMIEGRVSDKNRKLLDSIARYCVDAYEQAEAEAEAKAKASGDDTPAPTPAQPGLIPDT